MQPPMLRLLRRQHGLQAKRTHYCLQGEKGQIKLYYFLQQQQQHRRTEPPMKLMRRLPMVRTAYAKPQLCWPTFGSYCCQVTSPYVRISIIHAAEGDYGIWQWLLCSVRMIRSTNWDYPLSPWRICHTLDQPRSSHTQFSFVPELISIRRHLRCSAHF